MIPMADQASAAVMPVLKLANISKRFGGIQALQDVSVELQGQEIHALVGENGAGKSTLIKIVGGNLRPDAGQIVFKGKEVSFHKPAQAQALGISVIIRNSP
jgi:ABC-type sugar transport system ATPase subunit